MSEYVSHGELERLLADVDRIWCAHGAPDTVFGDDVEHVQEWQTRAMREELRLLHSPIRHMGTERCFEVLGSMRRALRGKVDVETRTSVESLLTQAGIVRGLTLESGREVRARAVILAPGREGAGWLKSEAERLGLSVVSNAVDIGVRVELPALFMEDITADLYEPKLLYTTPSFEDRVRTFCFNPHGVVCKENYGDVVTVNGHSYADAERKTMYTNFALLVSTRFTQPFNEPIVYGKSIARLANVLGEDIIVQRLGDLRAAAGPRESDWLAVPWNPRWPTPLPGTSVSRFPTVICRTSSTCWGLWTGSCPGWQGETLSCTAWRSSSTHRAWSWMPAYRPTSPACMRWEMGLVSHGGSCRPRHLVYWLHGQFWRNVVSVGKEPGSWRMVR